MNNQSKQQNNDFIKRVNEKLVQEHINLVITDNPNDVVQLGRLYKCVKDAINYGGPSTLIGSMMENFSLAQFGNGNERENQKVIESTKDEMASDFFEMKLAVMMIIEASEFINRIKRTQIEYKCNLSEA